MQFRALAAAILCLTAAVALGATPANEARATQFKRLPNWTGLWVTAVWQVGLSGRPTGGEMKLREDLQLLKAPPYNPEWNARYQAGVQDKAMMDARNATIHACTRSYPALMEAPESCACRHESLRCGPPSWPCPARPPGSGRSIPGCTEAP